jgi:hypothetical protein
VREVEEGGEGAMVAHRRDLGRESWERRVAAAAEGRGRGATLRGRVGELGFILI